MEEDFLRFLLFTYDFKYASTDILHIRNNVTWNHKIQ